MLERLLNFFRRRRVSAELGEVVALGGVVSIRVWDLWLDVERDGSMRSDGVLLGPLPVEVGRYRIEEGPQPGTVVVGLVPVPDRAFRGAHSWFCESRCTPLVDSEFLGVALAGPESVSVSESLEHDWAQDAWAQKKVPRFVVAGYYSLSAADVQAARDHDTVTLEVENEASGETWEETVDGLHGRYRYEVTGMNVSPARPPTPPAGVPAAEPTFSSIGGYFNAQLGLYVTDSDEPYNLRVSARCGPYQSDVVTIEIKP